MMSSNIYPIGSENNHYAGFGQWLEIIKSDEIKKLCNIISILKRQNIFLMKLFRVKINKIMGHILKNQ